MAARMRMRHALALAGIITIALAGSTLAQDLLPPDQKSLFAPSMAQLQERLDELRQRQKNDVMDSPEAVESDEIAIVDLQRQMQDLAFGSNSAMSKLNTLTDQQNAQEYEYRSNQANANAYDPDPP